MFNQSIFDQWNEVKKKLATRSRTIYFYEREIWWCSIGKNIGHEQDGKNNLFERPVLIIKKFNKRNFLAVPLSLKIKSNPYYHLYVLNQRKSSAIISQIRLLDVKRLQRKMGIFPKNDFKFVKQKIRKLI